MSTRTILPIVGDRSRLGRGIAQLELETFAERSLRDLELLGRRLGGEDPRLELPAGPGQRAADRVVRDGAASRRRSRWRAASEPTPTPRRASERSPAAGGARLLTSALPGGGRDEERAEHVRSAPLVLSRSQLAVLVAADRDVLGPVVRRELGASQRRGRRDDREKRRRDLLRAGLRPLERSERTAIVVPSIAATARGARNGSLASGSARCTAGSTASSLRHPRRARAGSASVTSTERIDFRSEATRSVPSSVRTAHAQ